MAVNGNTALTSVARVCSELGIAVPTPGALMTFLEDAVDEVSDEIARFLNRPLGLGFRAGVVELVKGYGTTRVFAGLTPLFALGAASVIDSNGIAADVDLGSLILERSGRTGAIYRAIKWPFTGTMAAGITQDGQAGTERESIQLTYDGGWALPGQSGLPDGVEVLPPSIRRAATLACVSAYSNRARDKGIVAESLKSHNVTYEARGVSGVDGWTLPASAQGILMQFRRVAMAG